MPRKKKELPADLDALLDDESQDDLRDPEDVVADTIDLSAAVSLNQAYHMVASTREGHAVLRDILAISGYQNAPEMFTGESCLYLAARRAVWVEARKHLTNIVLATIENPIGGSP